MGRLVGLCSLALLLLPALALGPSLAVDRGPSGEVRVSALPAALVVLDPAVWRAARNSGVAASGITLGSMVGGLTLGTILARRRFWGRGPLALLLLAPLVVGPFGVALGVRLALGDDSTWAWLAARSVLGQPGDDWARWLILGATGIIGGVPVATLAVRAALERVDPAWADAARVVGAGRWRVWRDGTWPIVRPGLAGAGSLVFAWSLLEPGAPAVLGLRRTLPSALIDAADRSDGNRAAALAALALGLAAGGRVLLRRWGRASRVPETAGPPPVPPRAGRLGGLLSSGLLGGWGLLAVAPGVILGRRLIADALGAEGLSESTARRIAASAGDAEVITWLSNSAATATLAVGGDALLLAVLGMGGVAAGARWGRRLAVMPPLALGAGALGLPALVAALGAGWPALGATGSAALGWIGRELAPGRSPGWLLVLVLAASRWPLLARGGALGPRQVDPALVEAGLLAGASPRAARRVAAKSGRSGRRLGPLGVAWAWAATDLAAAILLTPLPERQTLAPAALDLLTRPGDGASAARLLVVALVLGGVRLIGLLALIRTNPNRRTVDWPLLP